MEGGSLLVDIAGYKPVVLGDTVAEVAFRLLHRAVGSVVHARRQVLPIMTALYAEDKEAVAAAQRIAADYDAKVVADLLHSFIRLVSADGDVTGSQHAGPFDLSAAMPLEAPDFYVPQSMFFGKPYWGQPLRGVHLRPGNGTDPVPLSLEIEREAGPTQETFPDGIGVGTRSVLTYLVPTGVYSTFEVWAGVNRIGDSAGSVVFEVYADGKSAGRVGPLTADSPAHQFSVPLKGVSAIRLVASGGDPAAAEGNYAVWGRPQLLK
jgi:hypothetical protein